MIPLWIGAIETFLASRLELSKGQLLSPLHLGLICALALPDQILPPGEQVLCVAVRPETLQEIVSGLSLITLANMHQPLRYRIALVTTNRGKEIIIV